MVVIYLKLLFFLGFMVLSRSSAFGREIAAREMKPYFESSEVALDRNADVKTMVRMGYMDDPSNALNGDFKPLSGIGMGLGFKLSQATTLGYAYLPIDREGAMHRFNVSWKFN